MKNGLWLYLLAAYGLTVPQVLIGERFHASSDLVAYLRIACLLAFAIHGVLVYRPRTWPAGTRIVLACAIGGTWACLVVMELYRLTTFIPFTFSFAISSMADTQRTLTQVLGPYGPLYAIAVLALIVCAATAAGWWLLRWTEGVYRKRLAPVTVLCSFAALGFLVCADVRYISEEFVVSRRGHFNERPLRTPDYSALAIKRSESVFILQLESVNSALLFERSGNGFLRRIGMPGLETILSEGHAVFFPFFWANGLQTNRAHEAILCAISGNAGQALSSDPLRLMLRTCLPRHLARAGYETIFLYSFFDLDFFNFAQFQKAIGFKELVYGDAVMAPGDRRHPWGFDDCVFYERAFEYLEKQQLARRERLFAYFEVGTNHAPFGAVEKYPESHPYRTPVNLTEHYINSVAEQDHCLKTFWTRFEALGRDDIHLIIVPDHSVWMGAVKDPDAVFSTWLAYVPPKRRRAEFPPRAVLSPVPSQAQLFPTVLELLGAPRMPESFAFALQGTPPPADYDDCHVLADPYSRLIVVRNGSRAEYSMQTGSAKVGDGPRQKMDYWSFQERHGCT